MDKAIENQLREWVKSNYKRHTTGWTYERSEGHSSDCFDDGGECATSWAAYEVGCIMGMDLEEPECEEE